MWRKQVQYIRNTQPFDTPIRIAAQISAVLLSMAWRKGTNTHFCPFFGPLQLKSLIVRLADFVLIYIQISINLQYRKCWILTRVSQDSGTNSEHWIIGGRKMFSCMKQVWFEYLRNIQKRKKGMPLKIYTTRQNLTVNMLAATHIWPFPCSFPPLPGLFFIRKNKDYQGPKMIFYCTFIFSHG